MKKKVISISLICILVLGALAGIIIPIVYFIRGNFMQNLSEYMVDLDGATAFGISSDSDTARASSVNAIPNAKSNAIGDKKHHKNYMVVQKNGSDEVHKVDFKKRHDKDDKDSTISQEDMSSEIDKLYVLGDYTFISFVREGESNRPKDNKLEFDTDGIAIYDKRDYYTDHDRKSYIIDNTTGYIYAIVDFNIFEIRGGLLVNKKDCALYDFKVNSNDELEIYSLYSNENIYMEGAFKDKYGYNYVQNNCISQYDPSTKTFYYVFGGQRNYNYVWTNEVNYRYELTSTGEAIKLTYEPGNGSIGDYVVGASIIQADGTERPLTSEDTFDIYYDRINADIGEYYKEDTARTYRFENFNQWYQLTYSYGANNYYSKCVYRVENGVLSGGSVFRGYSYGLYLFTYDAVNDKVKTLEIQNSSFSGRGIAFCVDYYEDYGIILEYVGDKVYYYKDVMDIFDTINQEDILININEVRLVEKHSAFTPILVLENCSLSEYRSFLTYGVNGNTYYEIVVEEVDGDVQVNYYVSGTYEKPITSIFLQPINK